MKTRKYTAIVAAFLAAALTITNATATAAEKAANNPKKGTASGPNPGATLPPPAQAGTFFDSTLLQAQSGKYKMVLRVSGSWVKPPGQPYHWYVVVTDVRAVKKNLVGQWHDQAVDKSVAYNVGFVNGGLGYQSGTYAVGPASTSKTLFQKTLPNALNAPSNFHGSVGATANGYPTVTYSF